MKLNVESLLVCGCLLMAAMSAAAEETAYEGQPIGSIAVQGNGVNTIVAVAFKELSATNADVSVENIVSTEGLNADDIVSVYWNGGFETWTLVEEGGVKSWRKNTMKISLGENGQVTESEGADASAVRPPVGSGIWLRHQKGGTFKFHLFGAYLALPSTEAAAGTKTLMGNPCLEAKTPTITGMTNGDTIQFATESGLLNVYTYNSKQEKWGYWGWDSEKSKYTPMWDTAPEIPAGVGFWYVSQAKTGKVTFTW